jgi:hypothetical protein
MGLSPQLAKMTLEANALNLVQKVKEKKQLTASEIATLEAIAAGGSAESKPAGKTFADNQVELAAILGVERRTIQRWLKEPNCPPTESNGKYNVVVWREWARINGRKFNDDAELDKSALQARNILLQNERLQLANAEKRKGLIPRELAQQVFAQLIMEAKSRCFAGIPRFVTMARIAKDTTEASEEIRKEFNDIWDYLTKGKWFTEPGQVPESPETQEAEASDE